MSGPRVVVIGGGIGGAATALRLGQAGFDVVLTERSDHLGGLVMSLDIGGTPIERFYHHIFPHEHEVIALIGELGLADRLEWFRSSVGMLEGGRLWPFTSPLDLLRFGPLPMVDRLHTGLGALRSARWRDWEPLDRTTAMAWLERLTGRRGTAVVWEPLLRAKFGDAADRVPAAWMLGRFQQRAAARRQGVERLGYLRGGFRQLFDALEAELPRHGVKVMTGTTASAIRIAGPSEGSGPQGSGPGGFGPGSSGRGRVVGVDTDAGALDADAVVYAGTLPGLAPLVDPAWRDERWDAIGTMGAMAVVVELRRRITDTYWVNVCDPSLPLTAYIEHTNMVPASDYGGRHLAYLARYFTADDPLATADVEAEAWRWVDALAGGGLPGFHRDDVVAIHPARTLYAAPRVEVGHLRRIPPVRSHVDGLYVATTAQIYPEDRGMSEGIRLGAEAARHVVTDAVTPAGTAGPVGTDADVPAGTAGPVGRGGAWQCPVCGGTSRRRRFAVPPEGTEGGVSAEAFRPSSLRFGAAAAGVVTCAACGHGCLEVFPAGDAVASAYAGAADPVSIREETGQVATGHRSMDRIEALAAPGRIVDIGCWTGSLLVAARERGWEPTGVEPSEWAADRARERGIEVAATTLGSVALATGAFRAVVMCDVLEHLERPGDALDEAHRLLEGGGVLYVTVPDAGSRLARLMGRRWWSVLPMHLQYFTRPSLERLLENRGFRVVSMASHAKAFSARYYAERVAGYAPGVAAASTRLLDRMGVAGRLVAPDFRDRVEVVAVSR